MTKKHRVKVCTILNNIEHSLVLVSAVTRYVSTSAFTSLIGIPIGIGSSAVGLKIKAINARNKEYMSIKKK